MTPEAPNLTSARIDAVLAFLPEFEQPDLSAGTWRGGAGQFPYWDPNPHVQAFVQTLYDTEFVFSFDWGAWSDEAHRYTAGGAAALADADLLTLRRLLTSYVRADRFSEGTWRRCSPTGRSSRSCAGSNRSARRWSKPAETTIGGMISDVQYTTKMDLASSS